MMGNIAEKVPCDLKDQHVLIKQRHTLTKSLTVEIKNQIHFQGKGTLEF